MTTLLAARLSKETRVLQCIVFPASHPEIAAMFHYENETKERYVWRSIAQTGDRQHMRLKGQEIETDRNVVHLIASLHRRGWITDESQKIELLPEEERFIAAKPHVPETLQARVADKMKKWGLDTDL